jgi:hypothetical protein
MGAYNVVRFRVKPGCEQQFIDAHKRAKPEFKGFRGGALIKTGERDFCFVGEWSGVKNIAGARPIMIGLLDGLRGYLEDLGNDLGVTDPVSGEVVVTLSASKRSSPKARPKKAKRKKGKKSKR